MKANSQKGLNYITLVLGLCLIVLPFVGSDSVLDETLTPRFIFLNFTSLLLMVPIFFRKNDAHHLKYLKWGLPLVLLSLLYVLSVGYSHTTSDALYWSVKVSSYAIFFVVISKHQFEKKILWKNLSFFAMGSIFIAWMLMLQDINSIGGLGFLESNSIIHQIDGSFGHKNLFSSFLLILSGVIALTYHQHKKSFQYVILSILLINLFFFVFLQSKAVVFGMLVSFLMLLVPWFKSLKHPKRGLIFLSISFVFALVVFGLKYEKINDVLFTGSLQERIWVWENTVQMISENPIQGVGAGSFQIFFPKYGLEQFSVVNPQISLAYQTFQRPHNDYLWIFAEVGILGLLFYLLFFGKFLHRSFQMMKDKNESIRKTSFIFVFFMVAYLVVSFFDFPWERSEHQMVLMLLLVSIIPQNHEKMDKVKKIRMKELILFSLLSIIILFNFYFLSQRLSVEKKSKVIVNAHASQNWSQIKSEFSEVDPFFYEINNFSIPTIWYLGVAEFANNNIDGAFLSFKKAYELSPYQIHVINNYAGSVLKKGDFNKSIELYNEALSINPSHREILLNKSVAFFQKDSMDKAFHTFIEIDYNPEWSALYNKAFPLIFNKYLDHLMEENPQGYIKSWENIKADDSLKKVVVYEYHNNKKDWKDFLNIYNY